jgi:hypothetical protein
VENEDKMNEFKRSAGRLHKKLRLWSPTSLDKCEKAAKQALINWKSGLDTDQLVNYLTACQGIIIRSLLSAGAQKAATGRLKDVNTLPCVRIFAEMGSQFHQRCNLDHFVLTADEIARNMADRTGIDSGKCLYAWYAISAYLMEDTAIFPDISVQLDDQLLEANLSIDAESFK